MLPTPDSWDKSSLFLNKLLIHARGPLAEQSLEENPDLINVQPSMRWTALHQDRKKRSLRTESPWKMTDAVLEPQAAFDGNAEMADFLLKQGLCICIVWAIRSAASI